MFHVLFNSIDEVKITSIAFDFCLPFIVIVVVVVVVVVVIIIFVVVVVVVVVDIDDFNKDGCVS